MSPFIRLVCNLSSYLKPGPFRNAPVSTAPTAGVALFTVLFLARAGVTVDRIRMFGKAY